jgi:hypothetical protein
VGGVAGQRPTLLNVVLNGNSPADGRSQLGDPGMVSLEGFGTGITMVKTGTADGNGGSFEPLQSGDGGLA